MNLDRKYILGIGHRNFKVKRIEPKLLQPWSKCTSYLILLQAFLLDCYKKICYLQCRAKNYKIDYMLELVKLMSWKELAIFLQILHTLNSLISTQQILFFLRKFSHLHVLLEPTRLFILWKTPTYTIIRTCMFIHFQ